MTHLRAHRLAGAAVGLLLGLGAPAAGLELLGQTIPFGETRRLELRLGESFAGVTVSTPVFVVRGAVEGGTLCLTAGIHGDELNGVEIVRRVVDGLDPALLRGSVVGVPIANPYGFRRSSRYLPDRRDLNRYFPGQARGSSASRMAWALFDGVIRRCAYLVDFHTGSFHRTNLPQIRADLETPAVERLALDFGATILVHNPGRSGTLRRAASDAGVPSITYEVGEPMRLREEEIATGTRGTRQLMENLGMLAGPPGIQAPREIYVSSRWVRVDDGGLLLSRVALGDRVERGQLLGTVTDPIANDVTRIASPFRGRIIGMALDQVVIPGYAAYHVGLDAAESKELSLVAPQGPEDPEGDDATSAEPDERPE